MPTDRPFSPAHLPPAHAAAFARLVLALDERASHARELDEQGDREAQMDARRTLEALDRTRSAAVACAQRMVRGLNRSRQGRPTAVLAHRQPWMLTTLTTALEKCGFEVIGHTSEGAAALALTCVELPDLLLLEAHLPWLPVTDVLAVATAVAERTTLAVIAETSDNPAELRAAGADVVLDRAHAVEQMCGQLLEAMREPAA